MKIIAGEKRGFVLTAPQGDVTRPTLSRVRESVFSILGARVIDAMVVDLYAGAGTLGLEALSRGARNCVFVESGRHALDALKVNIDKLEYQKTSVIVRQSALTWASSVEFEPVPHMIFVDPPYHEQLAQKTLEALQGNATVPLETLLILQCGKRDVITTHPGPLVLFRTEKYGETIVYFFSSNS